MGIARAITYGNRVDVSEADALDFFSTDPSTQVVGLYVEGVSDGGKFLESLEAATKNGKTVVVLKTGKYETLSQAIASHTGAIAGSYASYSAAFRKAGAIEVNSLEEFLDTCKALSYLPKSKGKRVLIIGHAGGLGLTVADHCISSGLDVLRPSEELERRLRRVTLPFASLANPIDLSASGTDEQAEAVLDLSLWESDSL